MGKKRGVMEWVNSVLANAHFLDCIGCEVGCEGGNDARSQRIRDMVAQGMSQTDIIKEVWGIQTTAGKAYQSAAAEYRSILAKLMKGVNL